MSSLLDGLLPGIPDDVTFNHIATKLPWTACQSLSTVSLGWQQAIESRRVYDARVYHHSTQTRVVFKHQDSKDRIAFSFYSMREKALYKLPPIPHLQRLSQFLSLDGNLYLVGDVKKVHCPTNGSIDKQDIHVLDLAEQRQWKECANVPEALQQHLRHNDVERIMIVRDDFLCAQWNSSLVPFCLACI